jgi:hypothetical protein
MSVLGEQRYLPLKCSRIFHTFSDLHLDVFDNYG